MEKIFKIFIFILLTCSFVLTVDFKIENEPYAKNIEKILLNHFIVDGQKTTFSDILKNKKERILEFNLKSEEGGTLRYSKALKPKGNVIATFDYYEKEGKVFLKQQISRLAHKTIIANWLGPTYVLEAIIEPEQRFMSFTQDPDVYVFRRLMKTEPFKELCSIGYSNNFGILTCKDIILDQDLSFFNITFGFGEKEQTIQLDVNKLFYDAEPYTGKKGDLIFGVIQSPYRMRLNNYLGANFFMGLNAYFDLEKQTLTLTSEKNASEKRNYFIGLMIILTIIIVIGIAIILISRRRNSKSKKIGKAASVRLIDKPENWQK